MELTLKIDKDKIFKDVANLTAYNAAKNAVDETTLDKVAVIDEDIDLLEEFMTNAIADLRVTFSEYLIDNQNQLEFEFSMPSNFYKAGFGSLEKSFKEYIVNRIVADWYRLVNKTETEIYSQLALVNLSTAKQAYFKRERPKRVISK